MQQMEITGVGGIKRCGDIKRCGAAGRHEVWTRPAEQPRHHNLSQSQVGQERCSTASNLMRQVSHETSLNWAAELRRGGGVIRCWLSLAGSQKPEGHELHHQISWALAERYRRFDKRTSCCASSSRNSVTVLARPSASGMRARQPRAARRLTSSCFFGVPSGLLMSHSIVPW